MPSKKHLGAALERVKPPTIAMISADREGAPDVVARFLEKMEVHLFDEKVNVKELKALAGIRDNSFSTKFRAAIGSPPLRYLRCRQLEVAERLLREYGLEVGDVAVLVGMSELKPFGRRFTAWCGKTPLEVRLHEAPPEVDYHTYMRAFDGQLTDDEAYRFAGRFFRLYPRVARRFSDAQAEEPRQAEDLWRQIRELPFAEQRARVRRHFFRSTALFDLLRRKSREKGRRDRQRGIALAELALASLDRCAESWTERGHDHQAQGLADLANARRLALDFDGSAEEFRRAYAEWHTPRESPDELVLAEIYDLHASLYLFQRQFTQAQQMETRALELCNSGTDPCLIGKFLLQHCTISYYAGEDPEALITKLSEVEELIPEAEDYLRLALCSNLANLRALAGNYETATTTLCRARKINSRLRNRVVEYQLQMIDGLIQKGLGRVWHAENRFVKSRGGFAALDEPDYFCMASLELAIVQVEGGSVSDALATISGILPILSSLGFSSEAAAAEELIRKSIETKSVSLAILHKLRNKLNMIQMDRALQSASGELRGPGASRPSLRNS
jgi:AraC-like DNA-binding protein